jgi:SRSO17 transposase
MADKAAASSTPEVFDAKRWGLPLAAVQDLGQHLRDCWQRYRDCFLTKTRDTSSWALVYLRGLLLLPNERNYANLARRVVGLEEDGQSLQQFLADSPWSARRVFARIREEITQQPSLRGGVLALDESADARAGDQSAGAARQHNGRLGTVDLCQVGVALSYSVAGFWALVDAELYFTREWFDEGHAQLRRRLHVPAERTFLTKGEIGLALVRRARERGLPFAVVACDAVYGRDGAFRAALDADGITYVADVPED